MRDRPTKVAKLFIEWEDFKTLTDVWRDLDDIADYVDVLSVHVPAYPSYEWAIEKASDGPAAQVQQNRRTERDGQH